MAQILDTQVTGGGQFILDTQEAEGQASEIRSVSIPQDSNTVTVVAEGVVVSYDSTVVVAQANNTVAVVSATQVSSYNSAVSVVQPGNAVAAVASIPVTMDRFSARVRHKTTGAALTGLTTVTLTICDPVTGYRFDFADATFSATPTQPTLVLAEVSAANQPGLYRASVQTTNMNGWVEFEVTYNDGSYTYSYPGEAYYTAGHRAIGGWTTAQQAQVTAIQSGLANVPAAMLAAATSTPIFADTRAIRGQAIGGSGTESDPWGPA